MLEENYQAEVDSSIAIRYWSEIIDQYKSYTGITQYKIKNILRKADSKPYYDFASPDASYWTSLGPLDTALPTYAYKYFIFLPLLIPGGYELPSSTPPLESAEDVSEPLITTQEEPDVIEESPQADAPTMDKFEILLEDPIQALNKKLSTLAEICNFLKNLKLKDLGALEQELKMLDVFVDDKLLTQHYKNKENIAKVLDETINVLELYLTKNFFHECQVDQLNSIIKEQEVKKQKIIRSVKSAKEDMVFLKNLRIKTLKLWNKILKDYNSIRQDFTKGASDDFKRLEDIGNNLQKIFVLIKNDQFFDSNILNKLEEIDKILYKIKTD